MEYLLLLHHIFIEGMRYLYIFHGLCFSLGVSILAAIFGTLWGVSLALMSISHYYPFKNSQFNPFKWFAVVYIDLIRGTPAIVQLMILANVVFVGVLRDVPILFVAAIAFGLNSGAYVAEIIRAGIEGLDKGQLDAAKALGMPYPMAMKEIVIPQAIKKILPALVNEFITLLKETSIVGFIGGVDLLRAANIISSQTYRGVEPLLLVGIIYLLLVFIFTAFMRKIEERLKISD